jgi:hypothetical protein
MRRFYFLCFIALVGSPVLWSCGEEKSKKEFIEYMGPILNIDNLSISHSDSGRVKVKVLNA